LHDGDQGQSPWSQHRLTLFGEESGEHFILIERSELISHLDKGTAFWENGFGKPCRFLGDWANGKRFQRHFFLLFPSKHAW